MLAPENRLNWITDVVAFNKYFGWYYGTVADWPAELDKLHLQYPDQQIGFSEFGAGASIAQHDAGRSNRPDTKGPWHPEEWQCTVHEAAWRAMKERPWLWCTYLWCMFDF